MPVLVRNGRSAIAKAIKGRTLHLAIGTGDPKWDAMWKSGKPPEIDLSATALTDEVGRRVLLSSEFVLPLDKDAPLPKGQTKDIVLAIGVNTEGKTDYQRYQISETPTPHLYVEFAFHYDDATGKDIREEAVFMDTELKEDVAPYAQYVTPDQIKNTGELLVMDYQRAVHFDGATRNTSEYVINL